MLSQREREGLETEAGLLSPKNQTSPRIRSPFKRGVSKSKADLSPTSRSGMFDSQPLSARAEKSAPEKNRRRFEAEGKGDSAGAKLCDMLISSMGKDSDDLRLHRKSHGVVTVSGALTITGAVLMAVPGGQGPGAVYLIAGGVNTLVTKQGVQHFGKVFGVRERKLKADKAKILDIRFKSMLSGNDENHPFVKKCTERLDKIEENLSELQNERKGISSLATEIKKLETREKRLTKPASQKSRFRAMNFRGMGRFKMMSRE
ncbi:MAG: hypothetical protein ACI9S8_001124 [Chlamydiales bacterium]